MSPTRPIEEKLQQHRRSRWPCLQSAVLLCAAAAIHCSGGANDATDPDQGVTATNGAATAAESRAATPPLDMATVSLGAKGVKGDRPPRKVPGLP